jgi:hypothetical protein
MTENDTFLMQAADQAELEQVEGGFIFKEIMEPVYPDGGWPR